MYEEIRCTHENFYVKNHKNKKKLLQIGRKCEFQLFLVLINIT